MPIYLGSTKIGPLYFGNVKIAEAYLGSTKIYSSTPPGPYVPTNPYLIFEFSASNVDPSVTVGGGGTWTQISSSPNRWYWERQFYADQGTGSSATGWPVAFSSTSNPPVGKLIPANLGGGTCTIVGYGNLNYGSGLNSMDRMFANCTGLTEFVTLQTPSSLQNVGGCFSGCTELVDGALDQYTYWSTNNTGITNHSGTFTSAGSNTVSGLADLNQIPVGWGGNLVPASSTYTAHKQNAATWVMVINPGDSPINFANLTGDLYIFTTSSVSSYTGVNMRKSNIWNKVNSFSTSAATYYYPMFWQGSGTPSSRSSIVPTWIRCSSTYNGMLTAAQTAGDMPGTLDYGTYGPMSFEYGTYGGGDTYFGFLVVNDPAVISNGTFNPSTTPFGIHSNTNFRDSVINWFVQ